MLMSIKRRGCRRNPESLSEGDALYANQPQAQAPVYVSTKTPQRCGVGFNASILLLRRRP